VDWTCQCKSWVLVTRVREVMLRPVNRGVLSGCLQEWEPACMITQDSKFIYFLRHYLIEQLCRLPLHGFLIAVLCSAIYIIIIIIITVTVISPCDNTNWGWTTVQFKMNHRWCCLGYKYSMYFIFYIRGTVCFTLNVCRMYYIVPSWISLVGYWHPLS
jgi:hypothetical protein